jgi:hypothetical protein
MRVGLTFDLPPGPLSDLLVGSVLMALLRELTLAGLDPNHIAVTIDGYRSETR